ncbi:MAG: hypothetical protein FWB88_08300 [Defluviitaleaceae bacterium]|nr:hypothetical protein [Defluviitaleaceae bacterium]MCL2239483.1 hypothetical protein [Defluviitaleaceae bacterium]
MNDGKTFRETLREERDKLRQMNFREKREHIWAYYKLPIFFTLILIFVGGSIINALVNPPKEDYLYIAWLAPGVHPAFLLELGERLHPIVYDPERQRVSVSSYTVTEDPQMNAALQARFAAMVRMASIDVILTNREGIEELTEMGWIRPVCDVLRVYPAPLYDRLVPYPTGAYYIAISLSGSALLEEVGISTADLYLSIMANAERIEPIAQALEEMLR